jgi:maltose-binding protein MalE
MGKLSQLMQSLGPKKQIFSLFILIPIVVTLVAGYGITSTRPSYADFPEASPILATPSSTPFSKSEQKVIETEEPKETPVPSGTITLWHSWTGKDLDSLQQIISDFKKKNPNIGVDLKYIPHDDLPARLAMEIDGGKPDLLIGPSGWGPGFYEAGLIADVNGIAKPKFFEKVGNAALDTVNYKNALFGLPFSYNRGIIIVRNRSIFPEAPTSLDEYLEAANNITKGDIVGAVIDLGFFQSGAFLSACGGNLMDSRGYPLFDNLSGLCWIELLSKFQETGLPLTLNTDFDLERFRTGKTGFIIAGTWDIPGLAEAIDIENLAIDPWPSTNRENLSGFMETDVIYLSTDVAPENRVASRTLARYFLSSRAQRNLANPVKAGKIPTVKGIDLQDPLMQETLIALESGTPLPGVLAMDFYWEPMNNAIRLILMENEDPKQALESAAVQIKFKVRNLLTDQ